VVSFIGGENLIIQRKSSTWG